MQTNGGVKYQQIQTLRDKKWKEFSIINLFDSIQRGKRLIKDNQTKGMIPYVSSTSLNNGIDNFISYEKSSMRKFNNCLSLANSGSVGSTFYEPFSFVASDHITHLKNKSFNQNTYLFLASLCNRLSKKYNFNREINDTRISREKIMLPVNSDGEPDYKFMEDYISNITYNKYNDYITYAKSQIC
ncbi:MAG: restriction endonuclease subunit S [Alphaproteobacteria bacterium]|nr:restriction endonuclease subunit S [Alphaproteobacteria bacterium]